MKMLSALSISFCSILHFWSKVLMKIDHPELYGLGQQLSLVCCGRLHVEHTKESCWLSLAWGWMGLGIYRHKKPHHHCSDTLFIMYFLIHHMLHTGGTCYHGYILVVHVTMAWLHTGGTCYTCRTMKGFQLIRTNPFFSCVFSWNWYEDYILYSNSL